jgi:hypothetical protein
MPTCRRTRRKPSSKWATSNDPKTASLFTAMHHGVPADIKVSRDLAFGSDAAQKARHVHVGAGRGKADLIYVHGGGFTARRQASPGRIHVRQRHGVGRAARHGRSGDELSSRDAADTISGRQ